MIGKKPKLHSFSQKLTAYILLTSLSVFLASFFLYYHASKERVRKEAERHAESALLSASSQIDGILGSVETAVENIAWIIPERPDQKERLLEVTRQLVRKNPFISGSTIAFEPNYFHSKGLYYAPFSYREGKEILQKQLGDSTYQYHQMEWYAAPRTTGRSCWSEPYFDKGGGEMLMMTYSCPLYDSQSRFFGVLTADVSLEWLTETLNRPKPYPHSFNVMVGKDGVFIAHPKEEKILRDNIFNNSAGIRQNVLDTMVRKVLAGEEGIQEIRTKHESYLIAYAPVHKTGWCISMIIPQDEMFRSVYEMNRSVILIIVSGLLLMTILCHSIIRRLTDPLQKFAGSAREIAEGNFHTQLPSIHSIDEMRILHDSFEFMQDSLREYMEKLQNATAKKERLESELRIANTIQSGMLPTEFPAFPERKDIDLYARLIPAKEVSGDLYDYFINGDELYFCIGDVSGKGIPASLIMAVICRSFRSISMHFHDPASILSVLNRTLTERNRSNMFCTFFLGILNLDHGELRYCNAGHDAPLLLNGKDSGCRMLEIEPNLPLGVFEDTSFTEERMTVPAGSSLFLYTDGVTEAENELHHLYSSERLTAVLGQLSAESPRTLLEEILKDIKEHTGKAEQSDDITMLCLKRPLAKSADKR